MRNLRNTRYDQWAPLGSFNGRTLSAATWDLANDSVLCAFGPTENEPVIELVRITAKSDSYEHTSITSWDAPCPNPDLACDEILSLHYFADSLTACLVLAGGDITVVREEPQPGEDRIEIVGSVDEGITAAKWSPDEELLAITTKANTLVFMSRSFEGVTDVAITPEDLKASNHVSVGWGKKETQFKGKGAKAMRDPTMPEKIDEGVLSSNDDSRASISWRGDGAYLAISTIEAATRRVIRVYSREGVLDSVSEPVDGLEGALSWRPAGNLIAGIQRFGDRVDVVFFERNGLRHGQFTLRLTPEQLQRSDEHIKLSWNSDSTVLAVLMSDHTQLWTMGNYHWYLKQVIGNETLLAASPLVWHPEKPLQLLTVGPDSVSIIDYVFYTARSSTAPPNDHGIVAVIDGKSIGITPIRTANVPPPMALHDLEIQSNAIDVAFNSDASLIAVLHQDGISVFKWSSVAVSAAAPELTGRVTFQRSNFLKATYQQVTFAGENQVLVLQRDETTQKIVRYGFNDDTGRMEEVPSNDRPSSVMFTLSSYFKDGLAHPFVQDRKGEIHSVVAGDHSLSHCNSPSYLPWVEIAAGDDEIAFGLSSSGHLYSNSRLLVKNCTSFLLTPAHLVFTTTTHLLKFVHITNVNDLEVPPDNPEIDERCRSIERGARLVTAMPTSLNLVLQMPRGNLETIYPRAMVVAGIRKLIEEKNYKRAFTHCRTQRVDMNILYDHAPEQFLISVPLFIDQVKKITYIDLFLSSLREEDVTQTMYKDTRAVRHLAKDISNTNGTTGITSETTFGKVSKVNRICDAFLEVLKTRTATNLQNIITANVCKSPPALEDGLLVVAQLMQDDSAMADKAVEHICFLADVNRLYDNALGLYDLDLALLVAQQSQKDPREYLPFMQTLQEMTELRRRFSIDDYLSRHTKALTHLHALDAFSELQAYTQKHALYQAALSLYRYKPTQHDSLALLYASYLETKSSFKEAALAYESLHNYEKATSCYLASGPSSWRETLFCALSQTPPLSGPSLTDLATSLYDALLESKDYFSAGTIQLDYLSSIPNACRAYCRGYFFSDALHLLALKQRPELLEEVIDPVLGDALASSTELLAECKAQLHAQVPRIRELRAKALADPLAFYEGEKGGDGDLPDDLSVAASSRVSTNRSLFTRYTGKGSQGQSIGTAGTGVSRATSKNRRREERKRARGKKGSVYEEEYLVASVGRLIERVESVRGDVGRLVTGLVRRGMWERARAVESALADVVGMCQACVPEVFGIGVPAVEMLPAVDENVYRPVGGDAVLAESLDAAGKRKEAPDIKAFERLSLLGN
ncbi:IKI3 family protein [Drepanopeziza brunnea f. sp. 'multigermtubi' MB_m1]|uniref:Elongator complex protein 1 n=1 Tax=Marssonina brunnea f. sp. multigermtubi (strain MB_m1) TaxID=1072389 RepID=K1WGG8_MARBU|nr:IKI3 family protein [Drepanopeziza brunnea f. sp. 'multigermtubi' MB_m1]EKD16630.1 IKI3 family protein [Drepanopeziza brunnea f. sp. 'multigermtubi' MB_m1]